MQGLGDWFATIPLVRAINAVNLGKLDEAKAEITKALSLDPSWTAEKWRTAAFLDDRIVNQQVSDLIKAGLPQS